MTLVSLPGVPDVAQIDVLDLGGVSVPVVEMTMLDERTGCARAHRYLAGELDGVPGDYTPCHFYHGGRCDMNGRSANPCLFHEPESGRSWDKVKWWCLLEYPDGRTAITPRHSAAELSQMDGARVVGWEVVRV